MQICRNRGKDYIKGVGGFRSGIKFGVYYGYAPGLMCTSRAHDVSRYARRLILSLARGELENYLSFSSILEWPELKRK